MIEVTNCSERSSGPQRDFHKEILFSPLVTVICSTICVLGLFLLLWNIVSSEREVQTETASRDLERLASRMLGFESRSSALSVLEKKMLRLWRGDSDTQEQLREWYAELPHERRNSLDELYAGILNGEAELRQNLIESKERWNSEISPAPEFRRILDWVYINTSHIVSDPDAVQAQLAEEVPANWFYFQLAGRLAHQSGNHALEESFQRQLQFLTDPYLWRWRVLIIFEFALVGIGSLCLGYLAVTWLTRRSVQKVGMFNQGIYPWTFYEGTAVLVRGGALSIVLMVLLAVVPYGVTILEQYGSLLLYLPTVGLAMMLLCRRSRESLSHVLGCTDLFQQLKASLPMLLCIMALGLIGDWFIMLGGDVFDISVHWTEWFLPQLVWGSQAEYLKTAIEVVVLAPIFEEIIFRGLVFTTLRAQFSSPVSVMGSAGVFALVHGYGLIAFLSVFWSGLLWAWIYDRTGSVLPGILAHALHNALVVYFLVAIFR